MCGKAKKFGKELIPGYQTSIVTQYGRQIMTWGFNEGIVYNARTDKLNSTWKKLAMNKCILTVDSFYEKSIEFTNNINLKLGGIYNPITREFAILTKEADSTVSPYHHRMPVIIDDIDYFFNTKEFDINVFQYYIKLVA